MNEEYYIQLLSSQLGGFSKSGNAYNFRCPICLDSQHKKSKKRGYLFIREGKWFYFCHNCNASQSFKYFLKNQNTDLYNRYCFDIFGKKDSEKPSVDREQQKNFQTYLDKLPKLSSLAPFHPAKQYAIGRQIPTTYHRTLRFSKDFQAFTNLMIPGKFPSGLPGEPRIVIPIYHNQRFVGYQGRAIGEAKSRYITIVLDETAAPLVWNYDNVEWNAKHYIFEGVFDAMVIPNSIAVCGSALLKAVQRLNKPKNYSVLVFDNEPRNKNNVDSMREAVKGGYRICILPDHFEAKDVSEYVKKVIGDAEIIQTEQIQTLGRELKMLIDQNTYFGLKAELKLAQWSK